MDMHSLDTNSLAKIFYPHNVAVVGASDEPGKVGAIVFRNLVTAGLAGRVFPVNAKRATIQGVPAFASVHELPDAVDLAVICTPARTVPDVVRACGEAGILGLVILSAGFREAGEVGLALEREIAVIRQRFPGMRIVGPNCLGVMTPRAGLNASFACHTPSDGSVAFLSQSGALCTAVLDWAAADGFGFSHFVSLGNLLDVEIADLLDWLADDPHTQSAVLYIESLRDGRAFLDAARRFARHKPIVAYKSGRFAESAHAAASHTGAMAGEDAVYDAAFRRAGIVRVYEVAEIFDCAELLAKHPEPSGGRLAIVTNAGGPGVMAIDALLARRGELAQLSTATLTRLNETLPASWSHANPVDVLGDATPERFADALRIVLADEQVDAALAILTPQAMTDPTATAERLTDIARGQTKTVLTTWMGSDSVAAGVRRLNDAGIATFETPEKAVRAFLDLVTFAKRREVLLNNEGSNVSSLAIRSETGRVVTEREPTPVSAPPVGEIASKEILSRFGIPIVPTRSATSSDEAVAAAREVGFPVVLKVASPQISHKTDVGGVLLNVKDEVELRRGFQQIVASARRARPDASIDGVTVQPMIEMKSATELIVGAKRDPVFGPIVLVGFGGVTAELMGDRAIELAPLDQRLARTMLQSLRSWPLLNGYRGRPLANVPQLLEVIERVSRLIVESPEIAELDINPLLVGPRDVVALDARVIVSATKFLAAT